MFDAQGATKEKDFRVSYTNGVKNAVYTNPNRFAKEVAILTL